MGCNSKEVVHLASVHGKRCTEVNNVVCTIIIVFDISKSVFLFECLFAEIFFCKFSAKFLGYGLGFYWKVHIPMSKLAVVLIKNKPLSKQCFGG